MTIDPDRLADLVGPFERIERITAGRNSRAYRVETNIGVMFVKEYPAAAFGERDRLRCEYDALAFLERAGIEDVPRPIAYDLEHRMAAYEFVEGEAVQPDTVGRADIDSIVDFLGRLSRCNWQESKTVFASEACFSLEQVIESIESRIERLEWVDSESEISCALHAYIDSRLRPTLASVAEWALERARGIYEGELAPSQRTLSPSDFGFHNIVRRSDGGFVYTDFEHFGVDDPAKMISDFLLHPHPMMGIGGEMKRQFLKGILSALDLKRLEERVKVVYPLFGLKWCTILLNEFTPIAAARRRLAGVLVDERTLSRQLNMAEEMLESVQARDKEFYFS